MLFYVVIARWMYAEAAVIVPWATPSIDRFLASVELPTHDELTRESFEKVAYSADSIIRRISNDTVSPVESCKVFLERVAAGPELS